jgi:hypothetical protein
VDSQVLVGRAVRADLAFTPALFPDQEGVGGSVDAAETSNLGSNHSHNHSYASQPHSSFETSHLNRSIVRKIPSYSSITSIGRIRRIARVEIGKGR